MRPSLLPVLSVLLFALVVPVAASAQVQPEETVSNPAPTAPEAVIERAFRAARASDFKSYLALVHPDERATEEQVSSRQRYEWARFVKQASWYLKSETPITFVVVRREVKDDLTMKIFVKDLVHKDRMPVPVILKQHAGAWMLFTNSL